MLRNAVGGVSISFPRRKRYEGVRLNVISVGGCQISREKALRNTLIARKMISGVKKNLFTDSFFTIQSALVITRWSGSMTS